jgi:uncharacterized protein (DUF1330 family)
MAAYLLVLGKGTDRDRMAAYSRALPPIYARHGGRYIAFGGPGRGVEWLAGPWRDRSLVLARFDDLDHVLGFWWSDEYRAAARQRERAGQFTVVGLPGTPDDAASATTADAVYLVEAAITSDPVAAAAYSAAFDSLRATHGGRTLANVRDASFTALEGDPLFDRVVVTLFPTHAALDALLADPRATELAALRERAGTALLARANPPAPPAAPSAPTR